MTLRNRTTALAAGLTLATGIAFAANHDDAGSSMDGEASLSYGERSGGAFMAADLINLDGEEIGRATFSMTSSGIVIVRAEASGLEDGEHGFHIHETGVCEPGDAFASAGGHYVGEGDPMHGPGVEGGPHAGDMPNVIVANGSFHVEHFNPNVSLDGDVNPLADADGSALMIHSGPDDYESQPSGAAGDRVACGVISAGTDG